LNTLKTLLKSTQYINLILNFIKVIIISYVLITYIFYYLKYLFLFKQNQVKESRTREKKFHSISSELKSTSRYFCL